MAKKIKRVHFSSIDSTNSWAKSNAALLDPLKITLVTADIQRKGKGRLGNQWISPEKQNLLASYCFFLPLENKNLSNISQLMALSASKALEEMGFFPKLKWPNDILLEGKKVGGILTETLSFTNSFLIIVGIGMNINMEKETAAVINQPATSLFIESQQQYSIEEILGKLTNLFANDLKTFEKKGFSPFLEGYKKRFFHKEHALLRIREGSRIWEGSFKSLNADGTLNLLLPSNEVKRFYSGEIA